MGERERGGKRERMHPSLNGQCKVKCGGETDVTRKRKVGRASLKRDRNGRDSIKS